ncbi:MAG: Ig-like domain-containing protein [Chloroflexota bacterium]
MNLTQRLSNLPKEKRNIYYALFGTILLTIPCYCLGLIALSAAPPAGSVTPTPFDIVPISSSTPESPENGTPATETPTGTPTGTLEPTPTQSFPETATVTPTSTSTPTPSQTPTGTLTPSSTPTETPSPTLTPTLDATATAAVNATITAIADATATAVSVTATADAAATATAQANANTPPFANDDNATINQDNTVAVDVLSNDTDNENNIDINSLVVATNSGNGTAAVSGVQILYTPNTGFVGTDSFSYQICDTNNACDTATVTITVLSTNSPPVANPDTARTPQDTSITIDVAANDTDSDGNLDPNSVTVTTAPANGGTVITSGQITYTPTAGFAGGDTFTYQICDITGACASATVTIDVIAANQPPIANSDNATTTQGVATTIDVAANDTDADGNIDPNSVIVIGAPANGTTSVSAGQVTYTPNPAFTGNDTFTYQICDIEGACATATVAITVSP